MKMKIRKTSYHNFHDKQCQYSEIIKAIIYMKQVLNSIDFKQP